ncbi:MAG: helix-turn-helix domain-containing protein [Chloroflexi bacterium]|nr:helix-turn-helix domain-containing protein [Chloroflexota bacterium]
MTQDSTRAIARRIRAARFYAGKSREQVGNVVGRSAEQIGRYERGDWKSDPPGTAIIQAIARATLVPEWFLTEGFQLADDPATRFANAARQEAQLQGERPESAPGDRPGADAKDADA